MVDMLGDGFISISHLALTLETYDLRQSSVDHEAKMYLTLLIFHIQGNKYPRSVHHSNKYNPF